MTPLAAPLRLPCGATIPNRIAKSAMSEDLAVNGDPDERLVRLYARWGAGGTGLVVTGHVMVDRRQRSEAGNVVFDDQSDRDALARWTSATRANGAAFWAQLNHPGRQVARFVSPEPVAPSAVPMDLPGKVFAPPRALEPAEIEDIVGRFGKAAAIAKRVGFDGVEIHGAHGYLVSQFLSPRTNLRDDDWGGNPERRRRFLVEVVRAIRAAVGPSFPVGVKLNSADFQRGGFTEEESMEVVTVLEREGVDLLEISGGTYEKPAMAGVTKASTAAREAYFLEYARKVRAATRIPLLLTGGFRTRAGMEEALRDAVDMVGLARPLALEPELPRGLLDGTVTESRTIPHTVGFRQLDGLADLSWHTWQMHRIADGKDPDPRVGNWRVLAQTGWSMVTARRARSG